MRDPKRIDKVLQEVKTHWEKYPDLRLGQLVCILANQAGYDDPFYMEEDRLLKAIESMK